MSNSFATNYIILVLINLLGIVLSIRVYYANKQNKTNRTFLWMVITILSWITFYFTATYYHKYETSIILFRISGGFVFLFFISYYFFIKDFLKKDGIYNTFGKIIIAYGAIACFATVLTPAIISNVTTEIWGYFPEFTTIGWHIFYDFVIVLTILINIMLIVGYVKASKNKKVKIQYFLFGLLLFAVLNFIFNVIFQIFFDNYKYYQIGNYSAIFLLGFTAYAIVKQDLFGIKTVLTTFFVGSTTILLAIDAFILTENEKTKGFKIVTLFIFMYLGYALVKSVKEEVSRRKEFEKIAKLLEAKTLDLSSLFKASQIGTTSLHIEEVTQQIMNSIPKLFGYLGYIGAVLALYDNKNGDIQAYAITETEIVKKAQKLLGKKLKSYKDNINKANNFIAKTIKEKEIHIADKLEDFFSNTVPIKICVAIQKITGAKSAVAIPIISLGDVKGVITFVLNKKSNKIQQRDKELMMSFATQLGSTIENGQLYEKVEKTAKKLKATNKNLKNLLEAKSTFLSVASHQLRTPVSIAKGMLSMIVEGSVPTDKRELFIERSYKNVERLSDIIHDLLSASSVDGSGYKLNKQIANIDEIIEKIFSERRQTATEKKLYLKYTPPKKQTPNFLFDSNKITEVVANLIDNSIQYTQKGGVKIKTKIEDNKFIFIIEDTGIGIKKEDIPKLFKKISRLPEAISVRPSGTGLGLYLVKEIIEAHGGKVGLESKGIPGKGSIFTFYIPIKKT